MTTRLTRVMQTSSGVLKRGRTLLHRRAVRLSALTILIGCAVVAGAVGGWKMRAYEPVVVPAAVFKIAMHPSDFCTLNNGPKLIVLQTIGDFRYTLVCNNNAQFRDIPVDWREEAEQRVAQVPNPQFGGTMIPTSAIIDARVRAIVQTHN